MLSVALIFALALPPQGQPVPPRKGDVEVEAVGCVSGSTLTETNLNRNPSNGAQNPSQRWRLRMSKAQEKAMKEIGAFQVRVIGLADQRELTDATLTKGAKVGPGRAYIGVGSSKTPAPSGVTLPTLRVESIVALEDSCR